jgi:hypothetical protein
MEYTNVVLAGDFVLRNWLANLVNYTCYFKSARAHILEAGTYEDGLQHLKAFEYERRGVDLVISDAHLPSSSGLESYMGLRLIEENGNMNVRRSLERYANSVVATSDVDALLLARQRGIPQCWIRGRGREYVVRYLGQRLCMIIDERKNGPRILH